MTSPPWRPSGPGATRGATQTSLIGGVQPDPSEDSSDGAAAYPQSMNHGHSSPSSHDAIHLIVRVDDRLVHDHVVGADGRHGRNPA